MLLRRDSCLAAPRVKPEQDRRGEAGVAVQQLRPAGPRPAAHGKPSRPSARRDIQGGEAERPAGQHNRGQQADRAWTWLLAATTLVLAATAWYSRVLTVDSFYDLYAGRWIAAHGLPQQNLITAASRGAPWIDQQWLAHLAF
jgi:hypothetical protein